MENKFTRSRLNELTKEVYDWDFILIPTCFDRFDLILERIKNLYKFLIELK